MYVNEQEEGKWKEKSVAGKEWGESEDKIAS